MSFGISSIAKTIEESESITGLSPTLSFFPRPSKRELADRTVASAKSVDLHTQLLEHGNKHIA